MSHRRRTRLLGLLVPAALALTACGGDDSESGSSTPPPAPPSFSIPNGTAPSATAESTVAAPTTTPAIPQQVTARIGQKVTLHAPSFTSETPTPFTVTLSKARAIKLPTQCPVNQHPTWQYVLVFDITLAATGSVFYLGGPFDVKATNGTTYKDYYRCSYEGRGSLQAFPAMIPQTMKAGQTIKDILIYETPTAVAHGTITMTGNSLGVQEKSVVYTF